MSGALGLDASAWAQLRSLLDQGLTLPAGERGAWLAGLDDVDDTLKAHLRRLLGHAAGDADLSRFDALPRAAPPPDVGPYRCRRRLGAGGMSTVWLAERIDMMVQRPVALKRPRVACGFVGLGERMAQEREILARLSHPGIARIYDAGVDDDGQPWLALEYVEGVPIDHYVREHGLEPRAIVGLVLQITEAVAHAHARLVVHRDLKPGNILVEPSGTVRLLDFGIAKLVGEAQLDDGLTRDAPQPRTTGYAAPEQLLGQPVSAQTDVHALGVVLHELLTGTRPWRPARDTVAALEEAILHGEPVKPSAAAADRMLQRVLRGDLDTIVAKAIAREPGDRYGGMAEFGADLERWLQHRPIRARRAGARERAGKFVRRNRLALGLGAGAVSLLCLALAGALWQGALARREAAKALAIQGYLVGLFETAGVDQQDALKRREQTVQQLLEGSAESLPRALASQPAIRDELEQVVGRLLTDLELAPAAARLRRERVAQLDAGHAPTALRVEALRELGTSERQAGDLAAARSALERAGALCLGDASIGCQVARLELGRIDFAERHLPAALARVEPATAALRAAAPGSIELADALDLLGLLRSDQNRGDEAVGLYEESIAIRELRWGPDSVRTAIARFRLGRDLWALRHLARAEAQLRRSWQVIAAALGPAHLATARVELNLGRLTYYVGLRDDGLDHLRRATAAILSQADRIDPHEVLNARIAMGNALLLDGQLAAAGVELESALRLRERLDAAAWADPTLDQSWARWLLDTGRFDEARRALEAFRGRALATYGAATHPEVADRSLRLAWVDIAAGDLQAAQREIERVQASDDAGEAQFGSVKHKARLARIGLLIARGDGPGAQALAASQRALAAAMPRENQFRDVLFLLHELGGRSAALAGDTAQANAEFEAAIALLARVDPRHPGLAATRCRYAGLLARQGDLAAARHQLELARPAFDAVPAPGAQYVEAWRSALADVRNRPSDSVHPAGSSH